MTTLGLWRGKHPNRPQHRTKVERYVKLVTPWGTSKGKPDQSSSTLGMKPSHQQVALGITLLLGCLEEHVVECGDMIVIKTNVPAFERCISKDCYPAGLRRQHYLDSVKIHRLLAKPDKNTDGENRMMHPRQIKAWFVS